MWHLCDVENRNEVCWCCQCLRLLYHHKEDIITIKTHLTVHHSTEREEFQEMFLRAFLFTILANIIAFLFLFSTNTMLLLRTLKEPIDSCWVADPLVRKGKHNAVLHSETAVFSFSRLNSYIIQFFSIQCPTLWLKAVQWLGSIQFWTRWIPFQFKLNWSLLKHSDLTMHFYPLAFMSPCWELQFPN